MGKNSSEMEILFHDYWMTLVRIKNYTKPLYLKGRYVKWSGRWYRLDLKWGQMSRMKYASQVKKLNQMLEEANDG